MSLDAGRGLSWVVGDAEQLPFPACSMDSYTIAFGIRNVTRLDAALAEAHRARRTTSLGPRVAEHVLAQTERAAASGLPGAPVTLPALPSQPRWRAAEPRQASALICRLLEDALTRPVAVHATV